MKDNNRFLSFPLSAIRDLISDPEVIHVLLCCGLCRFCNTFHIKGGFDDALRQLIYIYYRFPDSLPIEIKIIADKSGVLRDDFYKGFYSAGQEFDPDIEIDELKEYFSREPRYKTAQILSWYRMYLLYDIVGMKHGTELKTVEIGKPKDKEKGQPIVAVNVSVMWDLYKRRSETTEEERAQWAMYFAMLSKIGRDKNNGIAVTTTDEIHCRMMGAKDKQSFLKIIKYKGRQELFDKYTTRRKSEKLRKLVGQENGVLCIGVGRRIYISYNYPDEESFAKAIEEMKSQPKSKKSGDKTPVASDAPQVTAKASSRCAITPKRPDEDLPF